MSFSTKINSMPELRQAIEKATKIYVQPRVGLSEFWIKIEKKEARYLLETMRDLTPNDIQDLDIILTNSLYLYIG